jgi:hypothetical protein
VGAEEEEEGGQERAKVDVAHNILEKEWVGRICGHMTRSWGLFPVGIGRFWRVFAVGLFIHGCRSFISQSV